MNFGFAILDFGLIRRRRLRLRRISLRLKQAIGK
jgi:hypothetical protein